MLLTLQIIYCVHEDRLISPLITLSYTWNYNIRKHALGVITITLQGILYMYYRIVRVIRRERVANKNGAHIDRIREAVFKNISFLLFFFTLSWFPNYVIEVMVLFSPGKLILIDHWILRSSFKTGKFQSWNIVDFHMNRILNDMFAEWYVCWMICLLNDNMFINDTRSKKKLYRRRYCSHHVLFQLSPWSASLRFRIPRLPR